MNIKQFYKNNSEINRLWCQHDAFSKTALDAIKIYPGGTERTEASAAAEFFINYTCIFLIKKPADFLYIFKAFKKVDDRSKFMTAYFKNDFVDKIVQEALLRDKQVVTEIGDSTEWIDLAIRLRARKLIADSPANGLDIETILPNIEYIDSFTIEYILSWAFEESKLNDHGIEFFEKNHPKKYASLVILKDMNDSSQK